MARSAAIRRLFESELDDMIALARLLCRNPHDVEDVVMDAFAEVVARYPQLDNPGGYLRTTVVNGSRRAARARHNRRRIREANVISLLPRREPPIGEHYLDDILATLTEREHTALVLVHYAGYSYDETADLMQEPTGTVKSLVSRTIQRLRKEVSA